MRDELNHTQTETDPPKLASERPRLSRALLAAVVVFVALVLIGASLALTHAGKPANASKATQTLGSMSFVLDPTRETHVAYDPANTAITTISATDANGYVWALNIPPGAVAEPETIGITPFQTVTGPTGHVVNTGVSFSPDGLIFEKAAQLTLTTPARDTSKRVMYTANADGSGLTYADMSNQNSAQIFHFSDAASGAAPTDPSATDKALMAQLASARSFLKNANTQLPTPPDVDLHCISSASPDSNSSATHDYVQSALQPELSIANSLLGNLRADMVANTGKNLTSQNDQVDDVIAKLMNRVAIRTAAAVSRNRDNIKAFSALANVAVRVNQILSAIDRPQSPITNVIGVWAVELANKSVRDVVSKHMYSNYAEIRYLEAFAQLLGTDTGDLDDTIHHAFTLKLSISEEYDYPTAGATSSVTGDITLPPTSLGTTSSNFSGSGVLNVAMNFGSLSPGESQSSSSFSTSATAKLINVCSSPQVQISQSAYGASADTTVHILGPSSQYDLNQEAFSTWVSMINNGSDTFTLTAQDGNSQVASHDWNQTYSDPSAGTATFDLKYVLNHAPS